MQSCLIRISPSALDKVNHKGTGKPLAFECSRLSLLLVVAPLVFETVIVIVVVVGRLFSSHLFPACWLCSASFTTDHRRCSTAWLTNFSASFNRLAEIKYVRRSNLITTVLLAFYLTIPSIDRLLDLVIISWWFVFICFDRSFLSLVHRVDELSLNNGAPLVVLSFFLSTTDNWDEWSCRFIDESI